MKITLKKAKEFLLGYSRYIYNKLAGLPIHQQEQIQYRISLCQNDCAKKGACIKCGCKFPEKLFVPTSCNPKRFPDIMNKTDWEEFKKTNNIY